MSAVKWNVRGTYFRLLRGTVSQNLTLQHCFASSKLLFNRAFTDYQLLSLESIVLNKSYEDVIP